MSFKSQRVEIAEAGAKSSAVAGFVAVCVFPNCPPPAVADLYRRLWEQACAQARPAPSEAFGPAAWN